MRGLYIDNKTHFRFAKCKVYTAHLVVVKVCDLTIV